MAWRVTRAEGSVRKERNEMAVVKGRKDGRHALEETCGERNTEQKDKYRVARIAKESDQLVERDEGHVGR